MTTPTVTAKELLEEFAERHMLSRLGMFMARMAEITLIENVRTDSRTNSLIFTGVTTWKISATRLATEEAIKDMNLMAIAEKIL